MIVDVRCPGEYHASAKSIASATKANISQARMDLPDWERDVHISGQARPQDREHKANMKHSISDVDGQRHTSSVPGKTDPVLPKRWCRTEMDGSVRQACPGVRRKRTEAYIKYTRDGNANEGVNVEYIREGRVGRKWTKV